jgi:hypothetical protein
LFIYRDNVYRSDDVHNNLNPEWSPVTIDVSVLCGGDLDHPIQVAVYDYESSGKHIPMGSFITSINALTSARQRGEVLKLKQSGKEVGTIEIVQMTLDGVIEGEIAQGGYAATTTTTFASEKKEQSQAQPHAEATNSNSFFAMTREFEDNKRKYVGGFQDEEDAPNQHVVRTLQYSLKHYTYTYHHLTQLSLL